MQIDVERHGGVIIFNLDGHFMTDNLFVIEGMWRDEMSRKPETIVLNCLKLRGVDSPAIGTLVKFLNQAMSQNIKLVFCDVNKSIRKLFRAARLNTFFTLTTRPELERHYLPGGASA